jgi:hypothetical protein
LDWLTVILVVLVQAERRDPAESLLCFCWLTDAEHERHDRSMTWLRKLGLLEAGAPHFRLTARGRVALAALSGLIGGRIALCEPIGTPGLDESGRELLAESARRHAPGSADPG